MDKRDQVFTRDCPCCEGEGCSECDGTGKRVTTYIDAGGGTTMRVHGSGVLSEEDQAALAEIGRLAYDRLASERDS